jgi:C-terminal peptidase prc
VRQLRIFDQLYDLILNNYLYPDFNGLNWPAWGAIYRERVAAGMTDAEFHRAMAELVSKLNDGHSVFQSPAAAQVTNAIIEGQHHSVGIGVEVAPRPERETVVLLDVYSGGPAWIAGLRAHDSLLTLGGLPILDQLAQLGGPAGSTVRLTVQTPGQLPRQLDIIRAPVDTPPPVTAHRWEGEAIIVITVRTFWDQNTASLLGRYLQELGEQGAISGVVIDLRTNRGGSEHSLKGTLSVFADGTLGYFTRRNGERPLIVTGESIHNSQTAPLIILIGRETSSYAEIFAGALQSTGRARLVGTVTGGNVETIWSHDFEDGSRVWIAEEGFRPLTGGNWEQDGIVPDFYVVGDWADFTAENDTQLETAIQLLQHSNLGSSNP